MDFQTCVRSIGRVRGGVVFAIASLLAMAGMASAQTTAICLNQTVPAQIASTGLAEQVGDIVLQCTGGTSGATVIAALYISFNTNITSPVDASGNPTTITVSATGATVTNNAPVLTSPTTLLVGNINYTVPSPSNIPVNFTISGIRVAAASLQFGSGPSLVNATLLPIGGLSLPGTLVTVAFSNAPLLSSILNNGIACSGSPLPASTDFNSFIAAGTNSSAVRVTEAVLGALSPAATNATNGTRILVQLTGYGSGVRLFAPNAVVGTSGALPMTAGEFNSTIAPGSYVPNANELLLSLVTGADRNGAGGKLVYAPPVAAGTFGATTELTVTNGSAYAVYEVVDHSPYVKEAVQIPIFNVTPAGNCATAAQTSLSAMEAPVSTVTIATVTDPIPRYIASPLASDCSQTGDCNANYFPVLAVNSGAVSLTGASLGPAQTATVPLLNNGGTWLDFTTSIAYQTGSGWLSVTPSAGAIASSVQATITANPATLQPGTYTATVTVNGGAAGTAAIPVTFTVGPPGITLQALVNAASFAAGPVSAGSYVALYGTNLTGTGANPAAPTVTINGLAVNVLYTSATQLNLIIPASLSSATAVSVVVSVGGQISNTLSVPLSANVPGIFTPGILNSDSTVNAASNPATRGTFIQVYLTGLAVPVTGTVTVNIGTQTGITPFPGQTYVQPTYPALDQVNVNVPSSLTTTGLLPLAVCILTPPAPQVCSNSVSVYIK